MFFRRKNEEEGVPEETKKLKKKEKSEDDLVWDKKRIIIVLFFGLVILLLAYEAKKMFLPNTKILGESTVKKASEIEKPNIDSPDVDLESKVESSISEIKENIINLDPEEVASSSPQIQKVLKDIQGIRDLPADKARNTCMKLCSEI